MSTPTDSQNWLTRRSLWPERRSDPIAVVTLLIFGAAIALWTVPFVPQGLRVTLATTWADPVVIGLPLVGFLWGIRALHPSQRPFWMLLAAAFMCASGGAWLPLLVPAEQWPAVDAVAEHVLFLLQVVCLFLALSLNPHVENESGAIASTRFRLESVSTVTFATLVLTYFTLIPMYYSESTNHALVKSMHVALGCRTAQGFLYSRPVPITEADALLRAGVISIESRKAS
jgi:hypothetical protein